MQAHSKLLWLVIILSLFPFTNVFGQSGLDDSQMRESAAARIMKAYGVAIDWGNTTLLEITDIEARLNIVARIQRNHGICFDWRQASLVQLTDAEARMNAADRIGLATKQNVDWKEYSLEDLLRMEAGLSQSGTALDTTTLSFDILFPPAGQQAMGLHKLSLAEKEELRKHIEALLIEAARSGAQQSALGQFTQPGPLAADSQASVIESKIDGDFEGWEGETIVKLLNGQIWQQTDYYYHYHYAFMPSVLIYNSGVGWKMKVDGIEKAVRVTQLR